MSLLCNALDRDTIEFVQDDITVVVAVQNPYVIVLNPNIMVDGCPLVTYASTGGCDMFSKILSDVCRGHYYSVLFSKDKNNHMKNLHVFHGCKVIKEISEFAQYVYTKWSGNKEVYRNE